MLALDIFGYLWMLHIGSFHGQGGTPIAGWFRNEHPNLKDDDWGYPHGLETPISVKRNRAMEKNDMFQ